MDAPTQNRMAVVQADITTLRLDAIVNAANAQMAPGGGVCGAIHRAAGPRLADDCAASVRTHGPLETGQARATDGHGLPARWVIHALGPVWHGGSDGEEALLGAAYTSTLAEAARIGATTIGVPAISTGIFGFPPDRAAPIAVSAVRGALTKLPQIARVDFVCFDAASAALHEAALTRP